MERGQESEADEFFDVPPPPEEDLVEPQSGSDGIHPSATPLGDTIKPLIAPAPKVPVASFKVPRGKKDNEIGAAKPTGYIPLNLQAPRPFSALQNAAGLFVRRRDNYYIPPAEAEDSDGEGEEGSGTPAGSAVNAALALKNAGAILESCECAKCVV